MTLSLPQRDRRPPPGTRALPCGAVVAFVVALGCTLEDGGVGSDASEGQTLELGAEAPVSSLAPLIAAEPTTPGAEAANDQPGLAVPQKPSLEDLLRLPAGVGELDPLTGQQKWKPKDTESADKREDPQRPRLELETRSDPAAVRPSTSRSRTDVGLSVEVGEELRLRGGVRLEEESGQEPEDPVPTVGIEKRF